MCPTGRVDAAEQVLLKKGRGKERTVNPCWAGINAGATGIRTTRCGFIKSINTARARAGARSTESPFSFIGRSFQCRVAVASLLYGPVHRVDGTFKGRGGRGTRSGRHVAVSGWGER